MNNSKTFGKILNIAIVVLVIVAIGLCISIFGGGDKPIKQKDDKENTTSVSESTTKEPEEVVPVKTVTMGSAGDILIHKPILEGAKHSDGYDFNNIFTNVKKEIESCDYFVANLEVTLGGADKGYSTYPCFNIPDAIADAAKNAGIDCLLTSNNHCYDTGYDGLLRTISVVDEKGFDHVGTVANTTDKRYIISDVGGVKVGILCYTYETDTESGKNINGIAVKSEAQPLINSFNYNKLDAFYSDFNSQLSAIKNEGADITVAYLHWGDEYHLEPNSYQKAMAQKVCDLGVDVIIGGHPHVVEPMELFTSTTDPSHKTVCLYSMGNFVSNQRRAYMSLKDGHTEDGVIFKMTMTQYSDGSVTLDKVQCIPTWVYLHSGVYSITPLTDNLSEDGASVGLNSSDAISSGESSYSRTVKLVTEGEAKCNQWLKNPVESTTEATESNYSSVDE